MKHITLLAFLACSAHASAPALCLGLQSETFQAHQHVAATYGKEHVELDFILQRDGDAYLLLGLTPWGSRAFALRWGPGGQTFEAFLERALPFDPGLMAEDIRRVFLWGHSEPREDGTYERRYSPELLALDHWRRGRLTQRTFVDESRHAVMEITYDAPEEHNATPTVRISNLRHGYELLVRTSELTEPSCQ